MFDKFLVTLHKRIAECAVDGKPKTLLLECQNGNNVRIDVYNPGDIDAVKRLNEMVSEAANSKNTVVKVGG